jgi:hypothetical protein
MTCKLVFTPTTAKFRISEITEFSLLTYSLRPYALAVQWKGGVRLWTAIDIWLAEAKSHDLSCTDFARIPEKNCTRRR